MKAITIMFDTLSRRYLSTYGNKWVKTPNFERLKKNTVQFDSFFSGSLPCMPARRELHTGRYNFLHRSWGPLEPFDFSCFEELKKQNIYTHIVTDHSHYWEDGGATYLPRYTTWEGFRGQEGDRWVGIVNSKKRLTIPQQVKSSKTGDSFYFNYANRERMKDENDFSSVKTFNAGIEFIEKNHDEYSWLLQIEAFDPHEPFYVPQKYLDLYEKIPDDIVFDWPSYAPVCESAEEKRQVIIRYAALISMCDHYLGKVLDVFDKYDLWKDTMLLVNTDHGFLMGEHNWWGKNVQPFYNEITHLPFYYYDPRNPEASGTRKSLSQTIDIPATILNFFGLKQPESMLGKDLYPVLCNNEKIHDAVLFGSFGGHINVCDGKYVYMRSSINQHNTSLYEYTLMPTKMRGFIEKRNLKKATLDDSFTCFENLPVLKIPAKSYISSYRAGNKLFDIEKDPQQKCLIDDVNIEIDMIEKMRLLMNENECPIEQYSRIGIEKDKKLDANFLLQQRQNRIEADKLPSDLILTEKEKAQILFISDLIAADKMQNIYKQIRNNNDEVPVYELLKNILFEIMGNKMPKRMLNMYVGFLDAAGEAD
ncbi:MAG: sulfatase [Anaerorhabdus sp.]